jgi:inorganic pyrophosphatase
MKSMDSTPSFWDFLQKLVECSPMKIDRPKGTSHPRYPELAYPLDYGFLEGTTAGDGAGIDVWLGASGRRYMCGIILTVDLFKKDTEVKILLGCTDEEIQTILDFHNTKYMRAFLVRRPYNHSSLK